MYMKASKTHDLVFLRLLEVILPTGVLYEDRFNLWTLYVFLDSVSIDIRMFPSDCNGMAICVSF